MLLHVSLTTMYTVFRLAALNDRVVEYVVEDELATTDARTVLQPESAQALIVICPGARKLTVTPIDAVVDVGGSTMYDGLVVIDAGPAHAIVMGTLVDPTATPL